MSKGLQPLFVIIMVYNFLYSALVRREGIKLRAFQLLLRVELLILRIELAVIIEFLQVFELI